MHTQHDKPASFHTSPQEAMQAPPEEFLYLAETGSATSDDLCLRDLQVSSRQSL